MRERAEVVGRHESIKVQWRLQVETMRKEWEILCDSENTEPKRPVGVKAHGMYTKEGVVPL